MYNVAREKENDVGMGDQVYNKSSSIRKRFSSSAFYIGCISSGNEIFQMVILSAKRTDHFLSLNNANLPLCIPARVASAAVPVGLPGFRTGYNLCLASRCIIPLHTVHTVRVH